MRIGVMGATGFIGSHLIQDLSKSAFTQGFSSSMSDKENRIQKGDYGSLDDVRIFCKDLDSLIYAAGTVDPRFSQDEQYSVLSELLIGQLDLCIDQFFKINPNGKFIFFSSAGALYPKSFNEIHTESSHLAPTGFYGDLKLGQEKLISQKYNDKNIITLRPSNIFGDPYKKNKKTGIIDRLISSSLSGETINIFENLNTQRDYLYIDDLVSSVNTVLEHEFFKNNRSPLVYNISSNSSIDLKTLIDEVEKKFGSSKLIFSNQNHQENTLNVNSDKFRIHTDWTNQYSLGSALINIKKKLRIKEC
jgi:nucleoside-diphosphate-sugar epimerase